jgi:hypothetical protein
MDLTRVARAEGAFGQFEQSDPTQYLQYLDAVSSDVEDLGAERVRDTDTTHYRATLDPDRLPIGSAQLRALGDGLAIDAWIDADGLLRRMKMDLGTAGARVGVTLELYDYGVDVAVQAPPPGEVTDISSMLGGGGAYAGGRAEDGSA